MSIGNDDSTICNACRRQFFPGCGYDSGHEDVVFEPWDGFHVCLECTRDRFRHEHQQEAREEALMAMRTRMREVEGTRDEPVSVRLSTLAMAAWEAAEAVRSGALDHATAMSKLRCAAHGAGIDQCAARRTVGSAFEEVRSWATAA